MIEVMLLDFVSCFRAFIVQYQYQRASSLCFEFYHIIQSYVHSFHAVVKI